MTFRFKVLPCVRYIGNYYLLRHHVSYAGTYILLKPASLQELKGNIMTAASSLGNRMLLWKTSFYVIEQMKSMRNKVAFYFHFLV